MRQKEVTGQFPVKGSAASQVNQETGLAASAGGGGGGRALGGLTGGVGVTI